ncbi:hypothetical protein [Leisingera thetidis]|uniref:hypothetical protein n=1 Tax=Leisingera thetidis TaxID=2930199 RepID=UPI0021F6AABB|nr:hypothetical protein [Leisingera thetidis]
MSYATALKRAARHNPAWKAASVYKVAVEESGAAVLDASGEFQYDLAEDTYALRDFTQEDRFTLHQPYDGDAALTVITANDPNSEHLILWEGQFHKILEVLGADALRGTVRYRVKALPQDEAVPIRHSIII